MDKSQLDELKIQYDALIRLNELMEPDDDFTLKESRHGLSDIKFYDTKRDSSKLITLIHDKDGSFVARIFEGPLRLSDKSKYALEAMSSMMAMVVKSVLNDELEEMKKAFAEIEIDGDKTIEYIPG